MAAVDLGSNSFHMVLARLHHGQLSIVDRLKEMVRLAAGLKRDGTLDEASQERALACLRRFGQRLRDMHAHRVRVVATNTMRKARDPNVFLARAEEALGHPVDVISGIEEARLIYAGVSHHVEGESQRRLVVDIGGGSTEIIVGEGYEPRYLESLALGCARMTEDFFADGKLSAERFRRARIDVRLGLNPVAANFKRYGWDSAVGSSGTIRVAQLIAHDLGLIDSALTADAVERVIDRMIAAGDLSDLRLPGLSGERAPVFAGGISILAEVMSHLGIAELRVSDGALREGLLYEMLGTEQNGDARDRTLQAVQGRFHVDKDQADRVETMAMRLLDCVEDSWQLGEPRYRRWLCWAARVHEIGLDISHTRYQQHGGYLLENADLPGFARLEQQVLATLVRYHRRKFDGFTLAHLQPRWHSIVTRLLVLLRLAVLLNRARSPMVIPVVDLRAEDDHVAIGFDAAWAESNPLTEADLALEQEWLASIGIALSRIGVGH
jgi:exopolyphosphatase/guanosine-5'-triphosphate,3'-diphosphate pyrophosphatase